MSVLRSIEGKIEGLFEGVFGRAFRAHVQPVELARKLAKEMDEHRSVSVSRVYVPNEYTVYLSTRDRTQFVSYEGSLIGELQEYLAEHARREGYALLTSPRVIITTDDDLAMGEFGIATRVVEHAEAAPFLPSPVPATPPAQALPTSPPEPDAVPAATTVYPPLEPIDAPAPEPPPAPTEVVTLTVGGRVHTVADGRAVIGRSRECDVVVDDANVSRRHCEVVEDGGEWFVVDLGSTNGTELGGSRVTRARLADRGRITIGSTDVVFGRRAP